MANSYTTTSEHLVLKSEIEKDWVRTMLRQIETAEFDNPAPKWVLEWRERFGELGFEWALEGLNLWIHGDQVNVEAIAEFVHQFLKRWGKESEEHEVYWTMTWAGTCSKQQIGEFGGGGVFVTAKSIAWFNTWDWISRARDRFLKRIDEKAKAARKGRPRTRR